MSSGNKATAIFTSTVHLADQKEQTIAALHKPPLINSKKKQSLAWSLRPGPDDKKVAFLNGYLLV